jgi:hypothetical protein
MTASEIALPRSAWPYWVLSAAVLVGLPVTSFAYFPALLQTGTLPADGDSIAIPMFGSIMFSVFTAPVVLGVTDGCVKRCGLKRTLLGWRKERPLLSLTVSMIFGLPVAALIFSIGQTFLDQSLALEKIWIPYELVWVAWLMTLRAVALANPQPVH